MSHCLTPDAPCGFHPDAHLFDQTFIRLLKSGAYHSLGNINAELREHAAEDAVDSTLVAVAAAGWNAAGHKVLNYEAPFGVGYGVAILYCKRKASEDLELAKPAMDSADGNLLPGIARRAVETALGGSFDFPPAAFGEYLNSQRGVFVTLHHANGELRGCVGTIVPVCASLVAETWRNARLAALHDDRFAPVSPEEMEDLRFEVSVLHPPEQITQVSQLDPGRYGVIVSTDDGRHGLLLPGIKHIKTAEQQLHFAEAKGFISPHEPVAVRRFEVDHFLEHDESPTTH
jgi:AmmeMemoRadiSam system protein A